MIWYLILFGMILFGPIIILVSRFVISYIYQWFFPGPHKINAVLRHRDINHDWKITQRSITSIFGFAELKFDLDNLNPDRKTYNLMLEMRAIMGKIKIKIPREMSVVVENKGFFGRAVVPGQNGTGISLNYTSTEDGTDNPERQVGLLVSSWVLFG
ncbi:MAG: LiaF domain-containing protein, partial [bacterium]